MQDTISRHLISVSLLFLCRCKGSSAAFPLLILVKFGPSNLVVLWNDNSRGYKNTPNQENNNSSWTGCCYPHTVKV